MHRVFLPSKTAFLLSWLALASFPALAGQARPNRVTATVRDEERTTLPGSMAPQARVAQDMGELPSGSPLHGITITFAPSPAQQADLDALLAAQQDPSSSLYHQWLTPEQFGARFGMSDADLAKVQSWLQGRGFTVEAVSRGRNRITFSGSAGVVANAFHTSLHSYRSGGETNFAPSADLSVPSAFAGTVAGVSNLSSFRPRPRVRRSVQSALDPRFTSSQTGSHFLTPKDLAAIYGITPAYNAGFNGAGQSIAVVGQSSVLTTDTAAFQNALGTSVVAPSLVLVPSSGTPTVYTGDEAESDLDIEYSGGVAPGASIYFVYTGNNANYTVFDALTYAIGERIAPVISVSYGLCEAALSSTRFASLNTLLAQASAQGQTVVAAAGDSGSTDCYGVTSLSSTVQQGLAVDFPASSPYVTGMGGTELSSANAASSTYWASASGSDVTGSALSYIPEQVWNDNSSSSGTLNLSATGGGVSTLNARPSWQTGVSGIPAGTFRVVPDISLLSSPVNVPYLYCSSDSSTGVSGSCSNGFRDVNGTTLTTAGGTSFAAPIFAGMVAIINQSQNSTGQGVVNSTLYALASNSTTYASVFHDITTGTNGCPSGATGCTATGSGSYAATPGYDPATGLGSFDFNKLLTAWPTSAGNTRTRSNVSISAATTVPATSTADLITIKIGSALSSVSTVPTGTVSLTVDGVATPLTLANGAATYSFSSPTAGSHTLVATYSGDSTFAPSTSTLVLTVGAAVNAGAFSVTVKNISISAGSNASSPVTVVSGNGYSGNVSFTLASRTTVANVCYSISNLAVSTATAPTTTLTIYTSSASCATTPTKSKPGIINSPLLTAKSQSTAGWSKGISNKGQMEAMLAGTFGIFLLGWRTRRMRPLLAILVLAGLGAGLSGCGSSEAASTSTNTNAVAAKGTYTFTLTASDTTVSSLNSSTSFTITIN